MFERNKKKHRVFGGEIKTPRCERGFTIMELMVVVTIMGLLAVALLINFNSDRANRNIKIAQSRSVTDLRKIQSNTLAARTVTVSGSEQSINFYLIKFDTASGNNTAYDIQAIYNIASPPALLLNLQNVKLPDGIKISSINISGSVPSNPPCALVAFKAPFAKILLNSGCSFNNFANDDYEKIKNYLFNSPGSSVSSDSKLTLTLSDLTGTKFKTVEVNGINGQIYGP